MAKYVADSSKAKRRKQRRAKRYAMFATMAVFVLVLSFGIVKVIEHFSTDGKDVPMLSPEQQPNTDVEKQADDYDTFTGPVQQTINLGVVTPEINMIQVAENGRVDISYFSDAVFMGDSLADGFRVYASSTLGLDTGSTRFLTRQSLSPSSFTQPGAMIDFGGGPIDPWRTLEQINPGKVYVTIGTNALNSGMDIDTFINSYQLMVDKIKQYAPNAVIYITTITPTAATIQDSKPNISIDRIYQANQGIARMCNENGLALINLYDVFKSSSGYMREDICAADGIHLTPSGYLEWLDYLITHTVYNPNSPYIQGSPYAM